MFKLILLTMVMASLSFVLGETTFFEADEDSFIMVGENIIDNSSVYCGNAICDSGEDCESCMNDCGVCPEVYSGGSGARRVVSSGSNGSVDIDDINYIDERVYFYDNKAILIGRIASIIIVSIGVFWLFCLWRKKK